jgi:uncharacterized OB-fold protein
MTTSQYTPIPVPDSLTAPFWDGARAGELRVQRCAECRRYQFPPAVLCRHCGTSETHYEPVSGRGQVYSLTEVRSGARNKGFRELIPYLVGIVELSEQSELFMYSNFPRCRLNDVKIGDPVEVVFIEISNGSIIPQFTPSHVKGGTS